MKIGAIDVETELSLLSSIRKDFKATDIEIRVDANGAFDRYNAFQILQRLADLDIHSIEQPIAAGQWDSMAELCEKSPLAIALDEELIPLTAKDQKLKMLECIKPDFIILKPSLIGGFQKADEWISLAAEHKVEWWATSALESNVGLNAIAQWCSSKESPLPQGLGTGSLYTNNIPSPLKVAHGMLSYDLSQQWNLQNVLDA